jgi:hypothetical protein
VAHKNKLFYAIVMVGAALTPGSALIACSSSSDGVAPTSAEGDSATSQTKGDASALDVATYDATDAWPTTK